MIAIQLDCSDSRKRILLTAAFCAQFRIAAGTALGKAATFYLGNDGELFDYIVQFTMAPTPGSLVPPLVRRMSPAILYILKLTLGPTKDIISAASALDDTFGALKEGNKWIKINDTLKRIEECRIPLKLDKRLDKALTLQQKREFWLKPTSEGIPAKPSVAKAKKRKRKSDGKGQPRSIKAIPIGQHWFRTGIYYLPPSIP